VVWFGSIFKNESKILTDPSGFHKKKIQIHPIIFGFFNWFGFEHHYKIVWFKNTEKNLRYLEMREREREFHCIIFGLCFRI
jgi:hypothetical protein